MEKMQKTKYEKNNQTSVASNAMKQKYRYTEKCTKSN
jgi:hypothetical protein